jgi:hypothetical protein
MIVKHSFQIYTKAVCRLGSAVQQTDEQLKVTNPSAPCIYLGRNALVDVSGTYQGEAVNVDRIDSKTVHCTTVNGTNPVRTLHLAQAPAPTYSKRIAQQANRVSDATRAAKKPRLSKDFTDSIVAVHDELAHVRRSANSPASTAPVPDFRLRFASITRQIAALQRQLSRPAFATAKTFSKVIADLKQSIAANYTADPAYTTVTVNQIAKFTGTGLQLPTQGLLGTKLRLYGTPTTNDRNTYSIGCSSGYMWFNSPSNVEHGFFVNGVQGLGVTGSLVKTVALNVGAALTVVGDAVLKAVSATAVTASTLVTTGLATLNSLVVTGTSTLQDVTASTISTTGLATVNGLSVTGQLIQNGGYTEIARTNAGNY